MAIQKLDHHITFTGAQCKHVQVYRKKVLNNLGYVAVPSFTYSKLADSGWEANILTLRTITVVMIYLIISIAGLFDKIAVTLNE